MQHLLMLAILKIKEIAEKLGLIADYVVEEGTSGVWTYRKWNSGVMEMWGEVTQTLTNYTTVGGVFGGYYSIINLPLSFIDSPHLNYNVNISNGFGIAASAGNTGTNYFRWHGLGTVIGTCSCTVKAHLRGRWK